MFDAWFWIWVVLAAVLLVAELLTTGLFMLPFGLGAAVAAAMNAFDLALVWQWLGFLGLSLVLFFSLRSLADRLTHEPPVKTGIDRLVGKTGVVIEDLVPDGRTGMVRIMREEWRADAPGYHELAAGTQVVVERVEGAHVVVRPVDEP